MTRYFRALRLRTAADRRVNAKIPVRCALAANLQKAPAHRKCRECFRRTVHDCPNERAAYFADILQRFCKMSKVRTWCNHTGRGPNEQHSAVRRRSVLFQLMRHAAHGKCLQPADAICIAVSRGTCSAQAFCTFSPCATWLYGAQTPYMMFRCGARFRRLQHIYNMARRFIRLHAGDRKLGIAPAPVQWEAHPIKPCERHCLTDRPAVRRKHR